MSVGIVITGSWEEIIKTTHASSPQSLLIELRIGTLDSLIPSTLTPSEEEEEEDCLGLRHIARGMDTPVKFFFVNIGPLV